MGKRVYFITGGFGFLGQYLVKAVYDHDQSAEARVQVRSQRDTHIPIRNLDRVRLISGDITHTQEFDNALAGAETVIHNAALVSFRKTDEGALFQSNVIATRNLIQAAIAHGCKNFIYISSISTIGTQPPLPSDETMIPDIEEKRIHDPYGYSKLMGEREVQRYASQIRVIILNPGVIIGPGSRRIEQILRWVRHAPILPMLPKMNSFVDVRDVARAAVLAFTAGCNGERYIVTGENVDMLTFTRTTFRILRKKAKIFPVSGTLVQVGDGIVALLDLLRINPGIRPISALNVDKVYSNQKIRREMAWAPAYTLEQSITDTIAQMSRI